MVTGSFLLWKRHVDGNEGLLRRESVAVSVKGIELEVKRVINNYGIMT